MFEALQASYATPILLTAGTIYFLAHVFGETRKLAHIPSIGLSDPILSYWSALQLQIDAVGYLKKNWPKIDPNAKFVKVPGFIRWYVIGVGPEQFQDLTRAPDNVMCSTKAVNEYLHAEYTLHNSEIGDNIQVPAIQSNLNRSLAVLVPEVHDEAKAAFEEVFPLEGNEWKSFVVSPSMMKIIGKISNRVLVGLPLCRDSEYIKLNVDFAVEVIIMSFVLAAVPRFLRGLVNKLVSPIPGRVKQVTAYLQPLINARREEKARLGDQYEPPTDFLTWLMDVAEENKRADRDIVLRMMSTNFGSIHTTTMTFTHALYSILSRPEHIDELRAEAKQCIEEDGWTKDAIDKMRFLDSFIKESQRLDIIGVVLGNRIAIQDCTLSSTFIPSGTMLTANVVSAHTSPSTWGPSASTFDPHRFLTLERSTGKRTSITTTSAHALSFGHGRHACPGRFFAAQEIKLLMAYMLVNYEVRLETEGGARPRDVWFGMSCMPNPSARISVRRREKV